MGEPMRCPPTISLFLLVLVGGCDAPESVEAARQLLTVLDGDGDGTLSEAEFTAAAHSAERFESWDDDGDGQVSATELARLLRTTNPLILGHQTGRGGELSPRVLEPAPPVQPSSADQ